MKYFIFLEEENSTELQAPVQVVGSDLVLTNTLDKEGLDGPSSFAVNVRCRRKKLRKTAAVLARQPDLALKGSEFVISDKKSLLYKKCYKSLILEK